MMKVFELQVGLFVSDMYVWKCICKWIGLCENDTTVSPDWMEPKILLYIRLICAEYYAMGNKIFLEKLSDKRITKSVIGFESKK